MNEPLIVTNLKKLGFTDGWALNGNKIIVWDNDKPQPTYEELGVAPDEESDTDGPDA